MLASQDVNFVYISLPPNLCCFSKVEPKIYNDKLNSKFPWVVQLSLWLVEKFRTLVWNKRISTPLHAFIPEYSKYLQLPWNSEPASRKKGPQVTAQEGMLALTLTSVLFIAIAAWLESVLSSHLFWWSKWLFQGCG